MQFEWDETKSLINLKRHAISFDDAHHVFENPMLTRLDLREDYGEERWVGLGLLSDRCVVIVFTEPEPDVIRVISLRKATSLERRIYEQHL